MTNPWDPHLTVSSGDNSDTYYYANTDSIKKDNKRIIFKDLNITLNTVDETFLKFLPEKFIKKRYVKINKVAKWLRSEFSVYVKASELARALGVAPKDAGVRLIKDLEFRRKETGLIARQIDSQNKTLSDLAAKIESKFSELRPEVKKELKDDTETLIRNTNQTGRKIKGLNFLGMKNQAKDQIKAIAVATEFIARLEDQVKADNWEIILEQRAEILKNNEILEKLQCEKAPIRDEAEDRNDLDFPNLIDLNDKNLKIQSDLINKAIEENTTKINALLMEVNSNADNLRAAGFDGEITEQQVGLVQENNENLSEFVDRQNTKLQTLNDILKGQTITIITRKSYAKILENYDEVDGILHKKRDPDLPPSSHSHGYKAVELVNAIIVAAKHFVDNPQGQYANIDVEEPDSAGNIHVYKIVAYNQQDQTISIISKRFLKPLGKGSYGTVDSVTDLTTGKRVAVKHLHTPDLEAESDMRKEKRNLQRFNIEFKPIHQKILPGLSFFPVQEIILSTSQEPLSYTSEQYQMDLWDWNDTNPTFKSRIQVFYQLCYYGAFCEKINFTNLDTKITNIFIKNNRIAVGDVSAGNFNDTMAEQERGEIGVYTPLYLPGGDINLIEGSKKAPKEDQLYREKATVFQIGVALFQILTGQVPYEYDDLSGPKLPSSEVYKNNLKDFFYKKMRNTGCSKNTTKTLFKLLRAMVDPDPLARTSCQKAFELLSALIVSDNALRQIFSGDSDYTGPWQSVNS